MRLNPPTVFVFLISLILFALSLLSRFHIVQVPNILPSQTYWLAVIAYIVLMFGNLVRGL